MLHLLLTIHVLHRYKIQAMADYIHLLLFFTHFCPNLTWTLKVKYPDAKKKVLASGGLLKEKKCVGGGRWGWGGW